MQMVLYSDPKSLTVPEEKDGVRRAIIEARHRVREKQKQEKEGPAMDTAAVDEVRTAVSAQGRQDAEEEDPDAMDMD